MPAKKKSAKKPKKKVTKPSRWLQFAGGAPHDPKTCPICRADAACDNRSATTSKAIKEPTPETKVLPAPPPCTEDVRPKEPVAEGYCDGIFYRHPRYSECVNWRATKAEDPKPAVIAGYCDHPEGGDKPHEKSDDCVNWTTVKPKPIFGLCNTHPLGMHTKGTDCNNWRSEAIQTTGLVDQAPETQESVKAAANKAYDDWVAAAAAKRDSANYARLADVEPDVAEDSGEESADEPTGFRFGFFCGTLAGVAASVIAVFIYLAAQ